jgi:hypothetical protein
MPESTLRNPEIWRRSSHCGAAGNCVEVAYRDPETVWIRDSKDVHGLVLRFTINEWRDFLAGVFAGDFDILSK